MEITLTHERIKELATEHPEHADTLRALFPQAFEDEKYFDFSTLKTGILNDHELPKGFSSGAIQLRIFGQFANKGFYLSDAYNWEIIRDNEDQLVLIPTKKQKKKDG